MALNPLFDPPSEQGKAEQMMEYIKRLRSCIKWFQEREDELVKLRDELQGLIESYEKRYADLGNQ